MVKMTLFGQTSIADSTISKNYLCLEFGGAGVIFSLNYERLIKIESENKFLFRAGLAFVPAIDEKNILIPFGLYYLIGDIHHLELGLNNSVGLFFPGKSSGYFNRPKSNYLEDYIVPSIGYRYENFYLLLLQVVHL